MDAELEGVQQQLSMSLQAAMHLLALSVTSCCFVQAEAKAKVVALAGAARKLALGGCAKTHMEEAPAKPRVKCEPPHACVARLLVSICEKRLREPHLRTCCGGCFIQLSACCLATYSAWMQGYITPAQSAATPGSRP